MALVLAATCAVPAVAGAAQRADLKVATLSVTPLTATAGTLLSVSDSTANVGARSSRTSTTGYFLSADRRIGKGDARLGRRSVRALKARRRHAGRARLTLPAATAAGRYYVVACADAARRVREGRETNNCRASAKTLRVTAKATSPGVTGPAAPAPAGSGSVPEGGGAASRATPLDVTPQLDSGAVTKLITTAGGELTTAGSDGTLYTLTFPADALFSDTAITMTPVRALDGLPGDLVGAVQLGPEGLGLAKPALLTIEPADGAPRVDAQNAFSSEGGGQNLHPLPPAFGPQLRIEVLHFSIAGIVAGLDDLRQALFGHAPASPRAQYEQAVAERIRQARARTESGVADDGWPSDLLGVHLAYYRDAVKPAMERALTDESAVDAGIEAGLYWLRMIGLYGNDADPAYAAARDEVYDRLHEILHASLDRNFRACVDDSDLRAIRRILQIARTAALIGFDLGPGLDLVQRCVRFELDLDSRVALGANDHHVRSGPLLLEMNTVDGTATRASARGEGPLTWAGFTAPSASGTYHCGPEPTDMTSWRQDPVGTRDSVLTAAVSFDVSPQPQGMAADDDTFGAIIGLDTGGAAEIYHEERTGGGSGCAGSTTFDSFNWENFWGGTIVANANPDYEISKRTASEGDPNTRLTTFTKVQRGGDRGQLVRVRVDDAIAGLSETAAVDVFHRPLR